MLCNAARLGNSISYERHVYFLASQSIINSSFDSAFKAENRPPSTSFGHNKALVNLL